MSCVNEKKHTPTIFIKIESALLVREIGSRLEEQFNGTVQVVAASGRGDGRTGRHGRHAKQIDGKVLACNSRGWQKVDSVSLLRDKRQGI